ncbi:erythromycin esterase family protein [Steroidobacter sp.]|uniref:erythromycin esterase family protein n=1 Tax=Steroidobacter sp. TaxID=1978227 RepID=UPI0025DC9C45|nr:erythromycin esterase family protein [Steroidobacter sp.]
MIGDATVVAVTEATHGAAEPLEFRNRLFQYLVEKKGFTAIAIESGLVEGRVVHDFVRGGPGTLDDVLANGISWTFDRLPANRDLIAWLRAYNADPSHHRKVDFYGFDVPGSPGNPEAKRHLDTALSAAFDYLARVDAVAETSLRTRASSQLKHLHFDTRSAEASGYASLSLTQRDALTATVADLIALLERKEADYIAASSANNFQWGYRAAIGARQADAWLRQIPVGWKRSDSNGTPTFFAPALDSRDRAQADNLEWVIEQQGSSGKILVFAHAYHLSTAPIKASWNSATDDSSQQPAGTYLKRRLGNRLFSIGNLVGAGEIEVEGFRSCAGGKKTLTRSPAHSFDGVLGEIDQSRFILDLRPAPPPVATWLKQPQPVALGSLAIELAIGRAYDALLYLGTVSPACSSSHR